MFSDIFSYVGRSDQVKDIACELKTDTSLQCNLGNPFLKRNETLQVNIVVIMKPEKPFLKLDETLHVNMNGIVKPGKPFFNRNKTQ